MSLELHDRFLERDLDAMASEILTTVGLEERADYYADSLSGGQKQRVALAKPLGTRIARALVSHPKIVLADEPTAALDKKSGRDAVELMQKLAKEQDCTILLVTHDNRILDIADRIVYMEDGRLMDRLKERFHSDLGLPAGTFIATLESLYTYRRYGSKTDEELVLDTIELLLSGALLP
jgi:putative ABC transport system ATP-binding protein